MIAIGDAGRGFLPLPVFFIPVRFCPSSPQPPSPTRGEGGVWASRCLKREMARRGFPKNLYLCSPQPPSPTSLGVDRTFEQRCIFWCCDGQSVLTLDPYPALRDRGKSEARLPRCDTVWGRHRVLPALMWRELRRSDWQIIPVMIRCCQKETTWQRDGCHGMARRTGILWPSGWHLAPRQKLVTNL